MYNITTLNSDPGEHYECSCADCHDYHDDRELYAAFCSMCELEILYPDLQEELQ